MADVQDELVVIEAPSMATTDNLDPCIAFAEAAVTSTEPTSPKLQRIRSLSCSILPDVRQFAAQEIYVTADDASERSCDSAPPADTPSITTAEPPAAGALDPQLLRQHRHHHKRNHKHRHGHDRLCALATHDTSGSTSTEDLVQAQHRLYCSEGNLLVLLEGRKAKSFTAPTRPHQPYQQYTSAPGLGFRPSAGTGIPRNTNKPQTRHVHTSSAGTSPSTMAHVVVAGRRSPAPGAQKQQVHPGSYQKQQAYGGGSSGGADDYIAAVLGKAAMQKHDRTFAERVKPEDIAKGFGAHWFSRHSLDVFNGSRSAAPAKKIISQVPAYAGLHLWVVRPPRSRQWVPVHLGSADNLQQALAQYIHEDGSCGPASEPFKHRVMLDLMARGFAVQVRYRPLKHKHASPKADEVCKLQRFDFPLNDKDNGGCRPIELPNGWQVVEYPAVNKELNKLLDRSFWTRRVT